MWFIFNKLPRRRWSTSTDGNSLWRTQCINSDGIHTSMSLDGQSPLINLRVFTSQTSLPGHTATSFQMSYQQSETDHLMIKLRVTTLKLLPFNELSLDAAATLIVNQKKTCCLGVRSARLNLPYLRWHRVEDWCSHHHEERILRRDKRWRMICAIKKLNY